MKRKIKFTQKKFKMVKKVNFTTSISIPKVFAPTVIANLTKGFASLTLSKMKKKVEAQKKAAKEARRAARR